MQSVLMSEEELLLRAIMAQEPDSLRAYKDWLFEQKRDTQADLLGKSLTDIGVQQRRFVLGRIGFSTATWRKQRKIYQYQSRLLLVTAWLQADIVEDSRGEVRVIHHWHGYFFASGDVITDYRGDPIPDDDLGRYLVGNWLAVNCERGFTIPIRGSLRTKEGRCDFVGDGPWPWSVVDGIERGPDYLPVGINA